MVSLLEALHALPPGCVSATKIVAERCGVTRIDGSSSTVRMLVLSGNALHSLEGVEGYPELRVLRADGSRIGGISELQRLACLPHLTNVWLAGSPVSRHYEYRAAVVEALTSTTHPGTPAWSAACRVDGIAVSPEDAADAHNLALLRRAFFPHLLWLQRVRERIQSDAVAAQPFPRWRHRRPVLRLPGEGPYRVTALLEDMAGCFEQPEGAEHAVLRKVERGAGSLDDSEVQVALASPRGFSAHDLQALRRRVQQYMARCPAVASTLRMDSSTDVLHTLDPAALRVLAAMLRNAAVALQAVVEQRAARALAVCAAPPSQAALSTPLQDMVQAAQGSVANPRPAALGHAEDAAPVSRGCSTGSGSGSRRPSCATTATNAASPRTGTSEEPIVFNLKRSAGPAVSLGSGRQTGTLRRAGLYRIEPGGAPAPAPAPAEDPRPSSCPPPTPPPDALESLSDCEADGLDLPPDAVPSSADLRVSPRAAPPRPELRESSHMLVRPLHAAGAAAQGARTPRMSPDDGPLPHAPPPCRTPCTPAEPPARAVLRAASWSSHVPAARGAAPPPPPDPQEPHATPAPRQPPAGEASHDTPPALLLTAPSPKEAAPADCAAGDSGSPHQTAPPPPPPPAQAGRVGRAGAAAAAPCSSPAAGGAADAALVLRSPSSSSNRAAPEASWRRGGGLFSAFWDQLRHAGVQQGQGAAGVQAARHAMLQALRRGLRSEGCWQLVPECAEVLRSEDEATCAALLWWQHPPGKAPEDSELVQDLERAAAQGYLQLRVATGFTSTGVLLQSEAASIRSALYSSSPDAPAADLEAVALHHMAARVKAAACAVAAEAGQAQPQRVAQGERRTKRKASSSSGGGGGGRGDGSNNDTLVAMAHNLSAADGRAKRRSALKLAARQVRLLQLCKLFAQWKRRWSQGLVVRAARERRKFSQ